MAKYKSSPHYTINTKETIIQFDYFGNYETSDKDEIAILDKNIPRYVTKVIEDKTEQKQPKAEDKPKQVKAKEPAKKKQAPAKRKSSAK